MHCFPCLALSKCAIHLFKKLKKKLNWDTGKQETMKYFLNLLTASGKSFVIATAAE